MSDRIKIDFKSVFIKHIRLGGVVVTVVPEIFLNWKLILLPKRIVDYVIIHELAHI